jgi:hypothetical protein
MSGEADALVIAALGLISLVAGAFSRQRVLTIIGFSAAALALGYALSLVLGDNMPDNLSRALAAAPMIVGAAMASVGSWIRMARSVHPVVTAIVTIVSTSLAVAYAVLGAGSAIS